MKKVSLKKLSLFGMLTLLASLGLGQVVIPTDPKMFHLDVADAPKSFRGNIKNLEWLVGNWRTERGGGSFREDTYLPLEGKQITGVNRAVANNQVAYMNHIVIWQDGDTVKMNHKNFGAALNLRGERDFRLLNQDGDYFYFTGLTLHRVDHDRQEAYFDFGNGQKQLQVTSRVQVANQQLSLLELRTEPELYPEGLAVDVDRKMVYLNSTNQNKIVSTNFAGEEVKVLETKFTGARRGTGLFYSDDLLYALGNNNYDTTQNAPHLATLQVIDTKTNRLVRSYERLTYAPTLFNDILVMDNGVAFLTNTSENAIYKIDTKRKGSKFALFLKSDSIEGPNGISISEDECKLFVATEMGIKIIDVRTGVILGYGDLQTAGNDGLKYHAGKLYGLQQGQLVQYQLDANEEQVISQSVLIKSHYTFDAPTSLQIINDTAFILANSQFGKRQLIENGKLDKSHLTNTLVLCYKLPG